MGYFLRETARLVGTTGSWVYLVGGVCGWMPETVREDLETVGGRPTDVFGV